MDTPTCLYRERKPARRCGKKRCDVWLASRNGTPFCALHGGWIVTASGSEQRESFRELVAK